MLPAGRLRRRLRSARHRLAPRPVRRRRRLFPRAPRRPRPSPSSPTRATTASSPPGRVCRSTPCACAATTSSPTATTATRPSAPKPAAARPTTSTSAAGRASGRRSPALGRPAGPRRSRLRQQWRRLGLPHAHRERLHLRRRFRERHPRPLVRLLTDRGSPLPPPSPLCLCLPAELSEGRRLAMDRKRSASRVVTTAADRARSRGLRASPDPNRLPRGKMPFRGSRRRR